jgi:hypothetical protein
MRSVRMSTANGVRVLAKTRHQALSLGLRSPANCCRVEIGLDPEEARIVLRQAFDSECRDLARGNENRQALRLWH